MDSLLQIIPWPFLLLAGYILVISIITFLVFVTDKNYAEQGVWRTKEKTLLILTLLGGTPGALLAMNQFRHKTRKVSFISKFIVIVGIQVAVVIGAWLLVNFFYKVE